MKVEIKETLACSANILNVSVGTNCPQGGDAGHGGRTMLRLIDEAGTAWRVTVDGKTTVDPGTIEIVLYGDCEAETFAESLEFAAKTLLEQLSREYIDL